MEGGRCEIVYGCGSGVVERMWDCDWGLHYRVGGHTREFRLNLRAIVFVGELCRSNGGEELYVDLELGIGGSRAR